MLEDKVNKEIDRIKNEVLPQKHPVKKVPGLVKDLESTGIRKFKERIFEEDFHTVTTSVFDDIVVPTIKNFLADIFIGSIERAFFGGSRRGNTGYRDYTSSLVRTHTASGTTNYAGASKQNTQPQREEKRKLTINDIIMRDRPSAQDLIDCLKGEIYEHGQVSIAELYEMIADDDSVGSMNFTDNYYGWKNLDSAYVKPHGRMFRVVLPKPVQLD